jgi:hypothetical protein
MKRDFKPTNPKDRMAISRLDLSLFPDTAVVYGSLGMTEGDCKYGGFNFRVGGVLASVYYAAAKRHLAKWFNGEWADAKTNVPHLGSALACVAIIIDAVECGVLRDDRPPKTALAKLLSDAELLVTKLHTMFPNGPVRFTEVTHGKKAAHIPPKRPTVHKVQESIATPKKRKIKRPNFKRRSV